MSNSEDHERSDHREDFHKLLSGVRESKPTKHQIDPDERDPVTSETADEAEETLRGRGLVNPFHAEELQRRQTERRLESGKELSFGGEGEGIIDVMEQHEEREHHRGNHMDDPLDTCPNCPDPDNEHVSVTVVGVDE